ncbi:acyloxyacyl hydrolase [Lacisediminimonas sp.]|uniref:acyloxyacyl hydrolase n=1 Tax=Lacisediminimonas sp. TaxID=3060582 RepID=UPI00272AEA22|nr:acyloxyacyl hydrolase [Lacisediminimonas sp.]
MAFTLVASAAFAVDSVALEYGVGNKTGVARVSAQWNWNKPLWQSGQSQLVGHWDVNASHWKGTRFNNIPDRNQTFFTLGVTPVLRWQGLEATGPYGEAGLGLHYFSDLYNNNGSQLSTHYQFGTLLGAGYRFSNKIDLGLRIQHFSNGGFKQPNTGINLAVVRAAYRF